MGALLVVLGVLIGSVTFVIVMIRKDARENIKEWGKNGTTRPQAETPEAAWQRTVDEARRKRAAGGGNADDTAAPLAPDAAKIRELEAEIARLRERGRLAVKQREEWERRALAAEERARAAEARTAPAGTGGGKDGRVKALKDLIAKEFHPDLSKAEGIEKLVRQEIFKQLWPRVEAIANG